MKTLAQNGEALVVMLALAQELELTSEDLLNDKEFIMKAVICALGECFQGVEK